MWGWEMMESSIERQVIVNVFVFILATKFDVGPMFDVEVWVELGVVVLMVIWSKLEAWVAATIKIGCAKFQTFSMQDVLDSELTDGIVKRLLELGAIHDHVISSYHFSWMLKFSFSRDYGGMLTLRVIRETKKKTLVGIPRLTQSVALISCWIFTNFK